MDEGGALSGLPPRAGAASGFWRWQPMLPVPPLGAPVSLGEGGTPLLLSRRLGADGVWWKDEARNPTGSHKDRALSLAATHALGAGARLLAVFSAGSTGLSAAAYAARAGLPCAVLVSPGAPPARLAPLERLGARIVEVEAAIDEGIAALSALGGQDGIYAASTTRAANPVQAEAARSIAFEIAADLGEAPDLVVIPTGGGGTLAAIHAGFAQLLALGLTRRLPELVAVVPERYDTLARAHAAGVATEADFLALPRPAGGATIQGKLAHHHPPDGVEALRALRRSGGRVVVVGDGAARDAVDRVGREEGLYLEPSSAVAWCAVERLREEGAIGPGRTAVVLACGSGFRETHAMLDAPPARLRVAPEGLGCVLRALVDGDAAA